LTRPIQLLLLILAFYLLLTMSPVKGLANNPLLDRIIRSAVIFSMIWGLYNLFNASHGIFTKILDRAGLATDQAVANIVATFLHILVVCLGFVMIAKEWNYDISAFIASLGIGSLAIALAAKDALSNVFGSLTILLDKPFKVTSLDQGQRYRRVPWNPSRSAVPASVPSTRNWSTFLTRILATRTYHQLHPAGKAPHHL
jgi:MscS family membrane protein